jgi:hypothetical protein
MSKTTSNANVTFAIAAAFITGAIADNLDIATLGRSAGRKMDNVARSFYIAAVAAGLATWSERKMLDGFRAAVVDALRAGLLAKLSPAERKMWDAFASDEDRFDANACDTFPESMAAVVTAYRSLTVRYSKVTRAVRDAMNGSATAVGFFTGNVGSFYAIEQGWAAAAPSRKGGKGGTVDAPATDAPAVDTTGKMDAVKMAAIFADAVKAGVRDGMAPKDILAVLTSVGKNVAAMPVA